MVLPVMRAEETTPNARFEAFTFEMVLPVMRAEETVPNARFEALRDEMLAPFAVTFDATSVPVVTVAEFIVSVFM